MKNYLILCFFFSFGQIVLSQGTTEPTSPSILKKRPTNDSNKAEPSNLPPKNSTVYQPKEYPTTLNLPIEQTKSFQNGVALIKNEQFLPALDTFIKFVQAVPNDAHGNYNIALIFQAVKQYKTAIKYYEKYKNQTTDPFDKEIVANRLLILEQLYQDFMLYNKEVVKADMNYVRFYFQKIQNGESVALAIEFIEFINKKYDYYAYFTTITEIEDKAVKDLSKNIAKGFLNCIKTIKKNPRTWDRDATPEISLLYLDLKDLVQTFK